MSALSRQREAVLQRDRICQALALGIDGPCGGRLQAAHFPPKARIKVRQAKLIARLGRGEQLTPAERRLTDTDIETVLSDPRLALALCERHHQAADALGFRGERDRYPKRLIEAIEEYGLESDWDRLWRPLGMAA